MPFLDLNEDDVDDNTYNSKSNSGSNETMENVRASIFCLLRLLELLGFLEK